VKSIQACTKTHRFEIKNAKIFLGVGYPSPDLPRTHPLSTFGASIFFAATALKLNVTTPEKKS